MYFTSGYQNSRSLRTNLTASHRASHSHGTLPGGNARHVAQRAFRMAGRASTARKSPSRGFAVLLCGGRRVQGSCCAYVWIYRVRRGDHARGTDLFGKAALPCPCSLLEVGHPCSDLRVALHPGRGTNLWSLDVRGRFRRLGVSCSLGCRYRRWALRRHARHPQLWMAVRADHD